MKQFKTLKEFKKVVRKYWKRHAKKTVCYHKGKKFVTYWTTDIWCYYLATYLISDHAEFFKYDIEPENIQTFIDKINPLIGKNVKTGKITGMLKGIAFANNGAYYVIQKDEELLLTYLLDITEI